MAEDIGYSVYEVYSSCRDDVLSYGNGLGA